MDGYEIYLQSFIFCYYNYCSLLFIKLFLVLSLLLNISMMIIIIIIILIRKVVKCERFCRRLLHVKRSGRFVWKFTDHILYSLERFAIKLLLFFKLPFAFHFSFNYLPISSWGRCDVTSIASSEKSKRLFMASSKPFCRIILIYLHSYELRYVKSKFIRTSSPLI